jgi:hypothetical protein
MPYNVLTITAGRACNMKERPANYKIIHLGRPEGKRGIGRPMMSWVGGLDQDSERIVVRKWKRQFRNMDVWMGVDSS